MAGHRDDNLSRGSPLGEALGSFTKCRVRSGISAYNRANGVKGPSRASHGEGSYAESDEGLSVLQRVRAVC